MQYSTSQLAALSGVSPRTLRYYDQIGLLTPPLATNGYRQYGTAEVDRLQLILTYRALGFSLAEIRSMLRRPAAARTAFLTAQRTKLLAAKAQVTHQLAQLDATLANQKGESTMTDSAKFTAYKQAQLAANDKAYGKEVEARYGKAAKAKADAQFAGLTEAQVATMTAARDDLKAALLSYLAAPTLPSAAAQQAYEAHRTWLLATTPQLTPAIHRVFGEMYVADPRFTAYYTKLTGNSEAAQALQNIIDYYSPQER